MIYGVPSHEYDAGKARPWLNHFASRDMDGATAAELEAEILAAERQLWRIGDWQAVALTRVTRDAVRITHCAGVRRHEWQEALDDTLREWARNLGKARVVALVRPGWARFGASRGYKEMHREMAVEV